MRPWIVWATGLLAYIVAVLDRTTLGVSGLAAADRFSAGPTLLSTFVVDQRMVKVLAWYDNEWGYSMRCGDLAQYIAGKS